MKVYQGNKEHEFRLVLGSCKNQFVQFDLLQTLSPAVTHETECQTIVNSRNRYSIKRLKESQNECESGQSKGKRTGWLVRGWRENKGNLRQGGELGT